MIKICRIRFALAKCIASVFRLFLFLLFETSQAAGYVFLRIWRWSLIVDA